jgi:hypothetical protein
MYTVTVHGFDYYNPKTGQVESGGRGDIAMWMIDPDYMAFVGIDKAARKFVHHAANRVTVLPRQENALGGVKANHQDEILPILKP